MFRPAVFTIAVFLCGFVQICNAQRTTSILIQNDSGEDISRVVAEYSRFYGGRAPIRESFDDIADGDNAESLDLRMPRGEPCVRTRLKFRADGNNYHTAWFSLQNRQHIQQVIFKLNGLSGFSAQLTEEADGSRLSAARSTTTFFQGTSKAGDVSKALLDAANNALAANPTFVRWELVTVTGSRGGIIGAKDVTAIIRVLSDDSNGAKQTQKSAGYSAPADGRHSGYIRLINETEDLHDVVVTVSNWRHTQNWSVQNGRPRTLRNLPSVGYGVAAFNPTHPRLRAIGGDSFQLAVPFEITVTGSARDYTVNKHCAVSDDAETIAAHDKGRSGFVSDGQQEVDSGFSWPKARHVDRPELSKEWLDAPIASSDFPDQLQKTVCDEDDRVRTGTGVGWFRSVNGWIDDKDPDYDYGAIILPDETLYQSVRAYFGFQIRTSDDLLGITAHNSGYPTDRDTNAQYFNADPISAVETRRLRYMIDTHGGQSGSPVWRFADGSRYVVGVHTTGDCPNGATRVIRSVFDNWQDWKAEG
ncbi:unnamed protein product [Cladocopium goreaui]|uniref:Serine protease n=1 Tax=Cladocopium goreaui TaxID=2562237 RepID=A0A9P1FDH3_9DINO|nr:unnamed protein product [Cladocopium goreaui]